MGFRFSPVRSTSSLARRFIAQHARWLTRALRTGRAYPRIPCRRVADGGFARLMATRQGRQIAQGWWYRALEELD